ncbi:MAG: ATP-binding protein [Dysgonamonadaceae bacterium]|jgi:predicted HTH transcriptional regulator|nr:ATP-binding protein [Dysgonamonadaceae bacterium]
MTKKEYITELIAQGEHQRLDFKFEVSDSKKIARTLSAFANSDGGALLIGVKDNGHITGIRSEEEYYMLEAASEMYCRPKVPFKARTWNIEGKTVLEAKVAPSPQKPHQSPDKYDVYRTYIRIDDENILAPDVLDMAWAKMAAVNGTHLTVSKPVEKLLKYLEINDFVTVNQFRKIARINSNTAKNILSDLLALGTIGYKLEDKSIVYGIGQENQDK